MGNNHRVSRLNEQLRRELTDIIRNGMRDPRIGMVTVTDVRVTSDLEHARVFVALMGDAAEQQESLAGLRAAAAFARGEIGRRLRIRHTPELRFEIDASLEHARRIEELLASVRPPEPEAPVENHTEAGDDDVA